MYKRILVPVDGSEAAQLGLKEGIKLAKALEARMRLLHVLVEAPTVSPNLYGAVYEGVLRELRSRGEAILEEAVATARDSGLEVENHMIEVPGGRAGEKIVEDAANCKADLIVCGTHGRRGLRRILLGSDAEFVVRHSTVPVLLVPLSKGAGAPEVQGSSR